MVYSKRGVRGGHVTSSSSGRGGGGYATYARNIVLSAKTIFHFHPPPSRDHKHTHTLSPSARPSVGKVIIIHIGPGSRASPGHWRSQR